MELSFKRIDEKDVDMLVMDRVSQGGGLLDLFLAEVGDEMPGGPATYTLSRIRHSATTRNGESDLVVVMSGPEGAHAIMIEDKIDAPAQHLQAGRYERRGNEGIAAGDWSSFSVVLIAPDEYLQATEQPYSHKLSYQRMREALPEGDAFGRRMLSEAIAKQESGWQPNRSDMMTAFYDEVALAAGKMRVKAECLHKIGDMRAERTAWVNFKSPLARTRICWKSEQGRVVLGFSGWGGKIAALKRLVGELPPDAYWRKPKAGVKRAFLCLDALYKVTDWAEATADAPLIVDALYKVQRLYDFALQLNNRPVDWNPKAAS